MTMTTRHHFFIVGGQRCGTTYLCHLLDQHPEIEMAKPLRPEPKFFLDAASVSRGPDFYEARYFGSKDEGILRGEKSTSYMESSIAARRLAAWFPEARIVFLLRDPVERAISHYYFSLQHGQETLPLHEAFLREQERRDDFDRTRVSVSPYAYLSRGRYIDSLLIYESVFPSGQIIVLLYEELTVCADAMRRLYGRLGVDACFEPRIHRQRVNEAKREPCDLPPEVSQYVNRYFAKPTARLARHLGVDLSSWWESAKGLPARTDPEDEVPARDL